MLLGKSAEKEQQHNPKRLAGVPLEGWLEEAWQGGMDFSVCLQHEEVPFTPQYKELEKYSAIKTETKNFFMPAILLLLTMSCQSNSNKPAQKIIPYFFET